MSGRQPKAERPKKPQRERPQNKKGRKMGRPLGSGSHLDLQPELIEKISNAVRFGHYIGTACALNGVGYSTVREWVLKAKEHPKSIYGDFARAMERAVAEAETNGLSVIATHAHGRAAEYLEEPVLTPLLAEDGKTMIFDRSGHPMMRPVMTLDQKGREVPLMRPVLDEEGKPILKRSEVKSSWQAAAWSLERRFPLRYGRWDRSDNDRETLHPPDEAKPRGHEAPTISPEEHAKKYRNTVQVIRALEGLSDDPDS